MVTSSEAAVAPSFDRSISKVVLLGEFGSGKSALFHRLALGIFPPSGGGGGGGRDEKLAQVGVFCQAAVRLPDGAKALLHDTCEMEQFGRSLTRGYYRGATCIILVADATNFHSVRSLDFWNTEAQCYASDATKILVFSKSDSSVADPGLIGGEIESYQTRLGCCRSAVVSSKTGRGIDQLLQGIADARRLQRHREFETLSGLLTAPRIIRLRSETDHGQPAVELDTCC